jgi:hypothetical protein
MTKPPSPQKQLDGFLDKYLPDIADQARACLKILRARMPGAVQLVYDNYQSLVIGFGPSERASEAIFSLVLFPRYLRLFFLQGTGVPDPDKLLEGNGNKVRSIRLAAPSDLNRPDIRELIASAIESARVPLDSDAKGKLVIRSILPKQRPRRPAPAPSKTTRRSGLLSS